MGYMSPGALKRTLEGGQVWYYSRSREDLWHKGEVSGNYLNLKEAWVDCDADTILMKVTPRWPHLSHREPSCFFTPLQGMPEGFHSEDTSAQILRSYSLPSRNANATFRRAATPPNSSKAA